MGHDMGWVITGAGIAPMNRLQDGLFLEALSMTYAPLACRPFRAAYHVACFPSMQHASQALAMQCAPPACLTVLTSSACLCAQEPHAQGICA